MKKLLQKAILERPLLGDGAMGTQLMLAGLEQGNCGEAWNLTHPERVLAIQRRYVEAGSDCLITNTFGGSRIGVALNVYQNRRWDADIRTLAKVVEGGELGDLWRVESRFDLDEPGGLLPGPFGGLLKPFGDFTEDQVRSAFEEQAAALVEAGADAIIIETQTSLEELLIGIQAAQAADERLKKHFFHPPKLGR